MPHHHGDDAIELLETIVDYPEPGVTYTDISRLLLEPSVLAAFATGVAGQFRGVATKVLGVESMGFLLAGVAARELALPLAVNRKGAKVLPGSRRAQTRNSYRVATVGICARHVVRGDRVLIVDDVLGTGGTFVALARLVEELGAQVIGSAHLVNLAFVPRRPEVAAWRHYLHLTVDERQFQSLPRRRAEPASLGQRVRSKVSRVGRRLLG